MAKCRVLDLGMVSYERAYYLQRKIHEFRREGRVDDVLLLLEHAPVVTVGRGGKRDNILVSDEFLQRKGIRIFEIDRGGDVTLHCPGQLVGYPIFDLRVHGKNIHKYLRNLEEVIIRSLKIYGIEGHRIENHTGVWVGEKKIASIGIGVKGWVAFHGFSININPDLSYFSLIRPCGLESGKVTSMSEISGRPVELRDFRQRLIEKFAEVFALEIEENGKQVSTVDNKELVSCFL